MRFSLLTLNLHTWQESDQLGKLDRIAQFAVEENVTAICLQECAQSRDAELLDEGPLRADNTGHLLLERLVAYGLKYSMTWDCSHYGFERYEEGSAVLSQLPFLGSCSQYVSGTDDLETVESRKVVMARLAVGPATVIDVYSVHLSAPAEGSESQADALVGFVGDTPNLLEQMKPPPPKRRGPPRKRAVTEEPTALTRLVCLAGDFNVTPDEDAHRLKEHGYLEASAVARETQAVTGTGTFEDGRWIDYVFVKPAVRPQSASVVFHGGDRPRVSDHYGLVVEFEV